MIKTQRRRVQHAGAVLQDANTIAVEAADHRPAGVGTVAGGTDTGQFIQCFAQCRFALQEQLLSAQHRNRRRQFKQFAAQRIAGDNDFLQGRRCCIGIVDLRMTGCGMHRCSHHGQHAFCVFLFSVFHGISSRRTAYTATTGADDRINKKGMPAKPAIRQERTGGPRES